MTEESVPGQWQALTLGGVLRLTEDLDVPKNVPFRWPPAELEEKGQGDHQEAFGNGLGTQHPTKQYFPEHSTQGLGRKAVTQAYPAERVAPWPGSTIRLFPFLDPQRGGSSC